MKKRILAITIAAALVLGLGTVAMALPSNDGTGTIGFRNQTVTIVPPIQTPWASEVNADLNLDFGVGHLRNNVNTVSYSSVEHSRAPENRHAGFAMNNEAGNITVSVQLSAFSEGLAGVDLRLENTLFRRGTNPTWNAGTSTWDVDETIAGGVSHATSELIRAGQPAARVFTVTQTGLYAGNWSGTLIVPPTAVQTATEATATMTWTAADTF